MLIRMLGIRKMVLDLLGSIDFLGYGMDTGKHQPTGRDWSHRDLHGRIRHEEVDYTSDGRYEKRDT